MVKFLLSLVGGAVCAVFTFLALSFTYAILMGDRSSGSYEEFIPFFLFGSPFGFAFGAWATWQLWGRWLARRGRG